MLNSNLNSTFLNPMLLISGLLVMLVCPVTTRAAEHDPHAGHHDHSKHMAAMQNPKIKVSRDEYEVPDVVLLSAAGQEVKLLEVLNPGEPIALNFIFTTCNTICPVMTATFAKMQRELVAVDAEGAGKLKVVSITIDPEYDRPAVLREYAAMFEASDAWTFLTGDSNDIVKVLKSFDAYAGSKMNHQPLTLLRPVGNEGWVRIDGLANGGELASLVQENLLNES